ncbi:hypothetical protein FHS19_004794 [Paenibacillus rhizosphaerae]|uniref:Lipoprotein n=1 Tax=Paenibacillus rhizosphaerae TaxID=297318 RepID=A0A839TXV1_9BACL|nr:hypothetical protein [Paenibacillus rhizosphaerae]MBB3130089.1 hypothetical protein [Paenibacillus rhizosphaerae]
MWTRFKTVLPGCCILLALAGCTEPGGLNDGLGMTPAPISSGEEAGKPGNVENGHSSGGAAGVTEQGSNATFADQMEALTNTGTVKSLSYSRLTQKYVYIKSTDSSSFEVYFGDYQAKTEKLVIKHTYSAKESNVTLSPTGPYFIVTRVTSRNPDRYKSELYYTGDLKPYAALNTFGEPRWDEDGGLIRSTEYFDKHPNTYQSQISVDSLKAVPDPDKVFPQTVTVVKGPETSGKTGVIFNVTKVDKNMIYYQELNLDTKRIENKQKLY